jgi:integrase
MQSDHSAANQRVDPPQHLHIRTREYFDSQLPPDSGEPEITANSTLSELFKLAFGPIWIEPLQLDAKTRDEYETSVSLWQRLSPESPDRPEPQLWQLEWPSGDLIGARFLSGLRTQPGNKRGSTMAIGTIRKHVRNINKLLSFAGPRLRARHGLKNLGVIENPILLLAPAPDDSPPEGDFTVEEVQAMWVAAGRMHSSKLRALGISAVLWWRGLLTVAAHTSLRRGQLLGLDYADLDPPFIRVRPQRSKRRAGRKQYLSQECLAAIERIRTKRERIFVWPYLSGGKVNIRYLDVQLRVLARRAGLPAPRQFGWNGFRKLAACGAFKIGGEEGSQAVLGHASGSRTAMRHYVSQTAQALRAAAIIDQLPSAEPASTDDIRQKQLFE